MTDRFYPHRFARCRVDRPGGGRYILSLTLGAFRRAILLGALPNANFTVLRTNFSCESHYLVIWASNKRQYLQLNVNGAAHISAYFNPRFLGRSAKHNGRRVDGRGAYLRFPTYGKRSGSVGRESL